MSGFAFRALGFPVRVSWSFFLISLLMGAAAGADLLRVGIWVAVVFASILVHELGHALVARRFRLHPAIALHGMGGTTSWPPSRRLSPGSDILITLAGPGAGLLLGGGVWLATEVAGPPEARVLLILVHDLLWVNVTWSLFNLLPILPLDGGQVLRTILWRQQGSRGAHTALVVSIATGAFVGILALSLRWTWAGILVLLLTYLNLRDLAQLRARGPGAGLRGWGGAAGGSGAGGWAGPGTGGGAYGFPRLQGAVLRLVVLLVVIHVAFVLLVDYAVLGEDAAVLTVRALVLDAPNGPFSGKVWQLFTYIWIHDPRNLFHLLLNCFALYMFGAPLAARWRNRDLYLFFILCGLGGGVVQTLLAWIAPGPFAAPVLGASGGVLGLVVAFSMRHGEQRLLLLFAFPMRARYLPWLVVAGDLLLWLGGGERIAVAAHWGGMITAWLLVTGTWRPSRMSAWLRNRMGRRKRAAARRRFEVLDGGRGREDGDRWIN